MIQTMSCHENDLRALTLLGLSLSQSKVYITIAKTEPADAKTIWKLTKVGRQDIYRILLELQKMNLVERIVASPSMYRAIPLEEGVSILLERRKEENRKLEAEAEKFIKNHQRNNKAIHHDGFQLIFIPEGKARVFRMHQSVGRTQRTADLTSTLRKWAIGIELLEKEVNKGVQTRGIVFTDDHNWYEKLEQPYFEKPNLQLRWLPRSQLDTDYCIYDGREAFISVNPADGGQEKSRCIWTDYPSIIKLLQNHFEMNWNMAKAKAD